MYEISSISTRVSCMKAQIRDRKNSKIQYRNHVFSITASLAGCHLANLGQQTKYTDPMVGLFRVLIQMPQSHPQNWLR
jgi:hypothetical protein